MRLSELAELEKMYDARGYRVVLQTMVESLNSDQHLSKRDVVGDDDSSWPTLEAARAVAERVQRLAKWQGFTAIVVLDPDNEEVERWPPAPAAVPAPPAPTEQRLAAQPLAGLLTILAQSDQRAVVGDAHGHVAVHGLGQLDAWRAEGRLGGPPHYTTFGSMLIGTQALQFQELNAGPGLTPTVAFYAGDGDGIEGAWFVHQPVQEPAV